ncbi:MAG: hypothetical protein CME71_11850 [Halobacteriovorax sp.]|nr:hypothetical protein [Halobacteriovorax sp.]
MAQEESVVRVRNIGGVNIPRDTSGDALQTIAGQWQSAFSADYLKNREQQGLMDGAKAQVRRSPDGTFSMPDMPDIDTVYGKAYNAAADINFDTTVRAQYRQDLNALHADVEQDTNIGWNEKSAAFQERANEIRENLIDTMPQHLQPSAISNFSEIVSGHSLKLADDSYNIARDLEFSNVATGLDQEIKELLGNTANILHGKTEVGEGEAGFTRAELTARKDEIVARLTAWHTQYPKTISHDKLRTKIEALEMQFIRAVATSEYSSVRMEAGKGEGGLEAGRAAGAKWIEEQYRKGAKEPLVTWLNNLESRWDDEENRMTAIQAQETREAQNDSLALLQLDWMTDILQGIDNLAPEEMMKNIVNLREQIISKQVTRSGGVGLLNSMVSGYLTVEEKNQDVQDTIARTLLNVKIRDEIISGSYYDIESLIAKRPEDKAWIKQAKSIWIMQEARREALNAVSQASADAAAAVKNIADGSANSGQITTAQVGTHLKDTFPNGDPFTLNDPTGWSAGLATLVTVGQWSDTAKTWLEANINSDNPVTAAWAVNALNSAHFHASLEAAKPGGGGGPTLLSGLSVKTQAEIKSLEARLNNVFAGNLTPDGLAGAKDADAEVYGTQAAEFKKQQQQFREAQLQFASQDRGEIEKQIERKLGFNVFSPLDQEEDQQLWEKARGNVFGKEDNIWNSFLNTDSNEIQSFQRKPDVSEWGDFMGYRIPHPLNWMSSELATVMPWGKYGLAKWMHLLLPGTQRTESAVGFDPETKQHLKNTIRDVFVAYPTIPVGDAMDIVSNRMAGLSTVSLLSGQMNDDGGIDPLRVMRAPENWYKQQFPGADTGDAFHSAMDVYQTAIHSDGFADEGMSPSDFDENPLSAFNTGRFTIQWNETLSRANGTETYEMLIRTQEGQLVHWRGVDGNGIVMHASNRMQRKVIAEKLAREVWHRSVEESGFDVAMLRRVGMEQAMIPGLVQGIKMMSYFEDLGVLPEGFTNRYTKEWQVIGGGPGTDLMGATEVGIADDYGPMNRSNSQDLLLPDAAQIRADLETASALPMGNPNRPETVFLDDKLREEKRILTAKQGVPTDAGDLPSLTPTAPVLRADKTIFNAISEITGRPLQQIAAAQRYFEQWRSSVGEAEGLFGYKYSDVYQDVEMMFQTKFGAVHEQVIRKYGGKERYAKVMTAYGFANVIDNPPGTVSNMTGFNQVNQQRTPNSRSEIIQLDTATTGEEQSIALLLDQEGFSAIPYPDGTGMSVGHGFRIDFLEADEKALIADINNVSHQEALKVLDLKVSKLKNKFISDMPGFESLTVPRQSALISMAYQLGYPGLKSEWSQFWRGASAATKMSPGPDQEKAFNDTAIHMIWNFHDDGTRSRTMWAAQTPNRAYSMHKLIRGQNPTVVQ